MRLRITVGLIAFVCMLLLGILIYRSHQHTQAAHEELAAKQSLQKLQQLSIFLNMYAQDHGNICPSMDDSSLKQAFLPYADKVSPKEDFFASPLTGHPFRQNLSLSKKSLDHIDMMQIVAFYDDHTLQNGDHLIVMCSGETKRVNPHEWERLRTVSGIK